jgi:hypothetical protein
MEIITILVIFTFPVFLDFQVVDSWVLVETLCHVGDTLVTLW